MDFVKYVNRFAKGYVQGSLIAAAVGTVVMGTVYLVTKPFVKD